MKYKSNSSLFPKVLSVCVFLFAALNIQAQDIFFELSNPSTNGGKVEVVQNESIKALIERTLTQNKSLGNRISGYRIQLFSDSKSGARERALKLRADFISLFPDFDPVRVYSHFEPPFIKVRVGDYRDENSALLDYKRFVKEFPDCYIVKTTIQYPPLGQ